MLAIANSTDGLAIHSKASPTALIFGINSCSLPDTTHVKWTQVRNVKHTNHVSGLPVCLTGWLGCVSPVPTRHKSLSSILTLVNVKGQASTVCLAGSDLRQWRLAHEGFFFDNHLFRPPVWVTCTLQGFLAQGFACFLTDEMMWRKKRQGSTVFTMGHGHKDWNYSCHAYSRGVSISWISKTYSTPFPAAKIVWSYTVVSWKFWSWFYCIHISWNKKKVKLLWLSLCFLTVYHDFHIVCHL